MKKKYIYDKQSKKIEGKMALSKVVECNWGLIKSIFNEYLDSVG